MKRADKAVDERDEYRYRLKEKMVENQTLNQELLKYKPKIDKSKNDKQSTGILLALLGAILFGGRVIKS
jgi:phage antirepressor YoqD-like protein